MEATRGNSCALLAVSTCFRPVSSRLLHSCGILDAWPFSEYSGACLRCHTCAVKSVQRTATENRLRPRHCHQFITIATPPLPDDRSSQPTPLPTTSASQPSFLTTATSSELSFPHSPPVPQPPPLHEGHPLMTAISSGLLPCGCHHHPPSPLPSLTVPHPRHSTAMLGNLSPF